MKLYLDAILKYFPAINIQHVNVFFQIHVILVVSFLSTDFKH